jgi:hypothetical protein
MNCIYCETQQPEKGFFCPNCFKQTRCKHCGEQLMKDVKICVICGEEIGQKISTVNINTIEFSESETERKFKASFTDTVGQSITESFGLILTNKVGSRKHLQNTLSYSNIDNQQSEIVNEDTELISDLPTDNSSTVSINDLPTLDEVKLRDLAKSETEWVLVYAYFASEKGTKVFTRENITQLYKETKRYTLSNSKNLSKNIKNITKVQYIKPTNQQDFILLTKGIEKIMDILKGNSKENKKKKTIATGDNPKIKNSGMLNVLIDLNLRPKDRMSLKDFAEKYSIKSGEELTLMIVYYLKEILNETVTLNHIYSCYKELGKKIPQYFKQTLTNQKNKKNWINVDDWNNIKFTIPGMNQMEHELKKV